MKAIHPGMKLQWAMKDIAILQEINSALKDAILSAPCLVANPGEMTYECRADSLCRVCTWRSEVIKSLKEEYDEAI